MNFYQKFTSGLYKTKIKYPSRKDFTKKCDCNCPSCNHTVFDKDGFEAQRKLYNAEQAEMIMKMKEDMLEDYGITNPEIGNIIYSEAYERGHSAGFQEVYNYMSNIVEFYEKIKEILMRR